jgi:hypothetical protein
MVMPIYYSVAEDNFSVSNGKSIDLSVPSSKAWRELSGTDFGIYGQTGYSVMIWVKRDGSPLIFSDKLMEFRVAGGGTRNRFVLTVLGGELQLILRDTNGVISQNYTDIPFSADTDWVQFVVAVNSILGAGDRCRIYKNGVDITSSITTNVDLLYANAITPNSECYIGTGREGASSNIEGIYHSAAVFNTQLTSDQVSAIYNNGNGDGVNLLLDQGSYSGSFLRNWWRFGLDGDNSGQDYKGNEDITDLGITSDDEVNDAPI